MQAASSEQSLFPAIQDIARESSAAGELRIRSGSEYIDEYSQHVAQNGSTADFNVADSTEGPGPDDWSYAVFRFSLDSMTELDRLSPKWAEAASPSDGNQYVALANWESNRWDWQSMDSPNFVIDNLGDYRRSDGTVLAIVLLTAPGSASLEWVRLGENAPPRINVETSGDGLKAPQQIMVDASASSDVDGSIAEFSWDWHDDGVIDASGLTPGSQTLEQYLGGNSSLHLRAVDNLGLVSELLLEFEVLDHSPWWCAGANRYLNRRSAATGPANLTTETDPDWSFELLDGPRGVLVGTDGTIYAGTYKGKVHAIDATDGSEITTFDEGANVAIDLRVLGPDGNIYAYLNIGEPEEGNAVLSLDADLNENWRITASEGARDVHGFTLDGGLLVSYADNELRSIDPLTRTQNWSYTLEEKPVGLASVADDGCVYIGGDWSHCYGFYPDGSFRNEYFVRDQLRTGPVINSVGNLLCVSEKNYISSFTPDNEELFYKSNHLGGGTQHDPCIGFMLGDERLIFGGTPTSLFNVKMDGSSGWTASNLNYIASGSLVDADENIYFSSGDFLNSYRPNKTPRWEFDWTNTSAIGIGIVLMLEDGSLLTRVSDDNTIHLFSP